MTTRPPRSFPRRTPLPAEPPAEPPGIPPAPAYPPELIGHVDITPENVIFRDGRAFALIDFDLAKPATRADEMFNTMMWWAPLSDPRDADPLLQSVDVPRRARILADAYGLSDADRERVIEVAVRAIPAVLVPDEAPGADPRRRLAADVGPGRR